MAKTVRGFERKQIAENTPSAEILRQSFELSLDMICIAGTDGYFKVVNPAWEETLGHSRKLLLTTPYVEFVHPDDRDQTAAAASLLAEGHPVASFENRYRCSDGSYKWLLWKAVPLPDAGGVFAIARDITDRKQSEIAAARATRELERRIAESTRNLRESNEFLRTSKRTLATLMSNLPGMAYRCRNDEHWTMEYVSEGVVDLTGHEAEELVDNSALSYASLIHTEDRNRVEASVQRALEGKQPFQAEYRIHTASGEEKWVLEKGRGVYDDDGAVLHLEGFITEVTDRKQAEQKIREQAALIDEAGDAIFVRDLDDRIVFWSRGAERVLGRKEDEVLGKRAEEVLPWGSSVRFREAMKTTLEQGSWSGDFRERDAEGREVVVESRWSLLHDDRGRPKGALTIATDVTERKLLEEKLFRVQRLESVGTLASGIAHDLNNALTPVLMGVQVLRRKYRDEDNRTLDMVESGAKRGAQLVKQVLGFGRGMVGEQVLLQLRHRVAEFEKVSEQTFPKSIRIVTDIPRGLWTVSADPTQLDQVLMNLGINARDAMPSGGTLTVRARNVTLDETYARMQPEARPGAYVQIDVADTGSGMPPRVRQRIFEPFFTTKESRGTGLGLATVHTIVKNHGGFVNVYSEVGRGSVFKVYLPAAAGEATEHAAVKPDRPGGRGETVLVSDDEQIVREMVATVLEDAGYRVVTAANGAEAVARYARGGVDLALVDWDMPIINGSQTVQAILDMDPGAKIIATSGISQTDQLSDLGIPVPFLPKPFTAEEVLGRLAEALASSRTKPDEG